MVVHASVPGTGVDSINGTVTFAASNQMNRPAMTLVGKVLYASYGSYGDTDPYHGWVMGFSTSNLSLQSKYNGSPNGNRGGIWMSGGAPAIDSSNNLYVITGNGDFDGTNDFGDSVLKLSSTLARTDFFTPSVESNLEANDLDLGSGGAVVLVDLPGAPAGFQHLLIGGGKGAAIGAGADCIQEADDQGRSQRLAR